MRNGRVIGNHGNANASSLDRTDGAFAAGACTLHSHFALVHALGNSRTGGVLSNHSGGERGGLARTLEASLTSRAPGNHSAASVSDRDLSVVESAADERNAGRNGLARTLLRNGLAFSGG